MTRTAKRAAPLELSSCFVIEDRCAPAIADRIIREAEPYVTRAARYIASDNPSVVEDLVQEARVTLWELDLGRFAQRDVNYLKRMLCTRMLQVYKAERRGGLTTGWSKHGAGGVSAAPDPASRRKTKQPPAKRARANRQAARRHRRRFRSG